MAAKRPPRNGPPLPPGAADLPVIATEVVNWQRVHGRQSLPWQNTRDPYRVWLSEIMLQQTQVSTVLGYYDRFLNRFPTVAALADAPLDEVLTLWSGLGYYSRARNLHACAQAVVRDHKSLFPEQAATLATLPGIGRSTASAISSFCFGERVAILDGNVKRVLGRVLAFEGDVAASTGQRQLWDLATAMVPDAEADMPAYTQGLMDLGATVCLPREPSCLVCPLKDVCRARASGETARFPIKSRKRVRSARSNAWLWLQAEGAVWVEQRPGTGVWAGLWTLPLFDDVEALLAELRAQAIGEAPQFLPPIDHALTHFDWRLQPCRVTLRHVPELTRAGRWLPLSALDSVALPAPLRKLLDAAWRRATCIEQVRDQAGASGSLKS